MSIQRSVTDMTIFKYYAAVFALLLAYLFSSTFVNAKNSEDTLVSKPMPMPPSVAFSDININVEASKIRGNMFVNGDIAEAETFADARFSLTPTGDSGPATILADWSDIFFDVSVINANYKAIYSGGTGEQMPVNLGQELTGDILVEGNTKESIEVPTIDVIPNVTLNGEALSISSDTHANIYLQPEGSPFFIFAGSISGNKQMITIIPGVYDLIYQYVQGDDIPLNKFALVQKGVKIAESGEFDVPIRANTVRSIFRLNGQAFPDSGLDFARMYLTSENGDEVFLGNTNENSSSTTQIIYGQYNLHYRFRESISIPVNQDTVISQNVIIDQTTNLLEVNVNSVRIAGSFTVNGATPPVSGLDFANIYLQDPNTGRTTLLGPTNAGSYQRDRIIAGEYNILYDFRESGIMPPQNNVIIGKRVFSNVSDNDIDIRTSTIDLNLTLNSAPFPSSGLDYGILRAKEVSSDTSVTLGRTNETFEPITLLHGSYTFMLELREFGEFMPRNPNHSFLSDTFLDQDLSIDYDIATTSIRVLPTLNFKAFPKANFASADILFADTTKELFRVASTGSSPQVLTVIKGEYDVYYNVIEQGERNNNPNVFPIASGPVQTIPINRNMLFSQITIK